MLLSEQGYNVNNAVCVSYLEKDTVRTSPISFATREYLLLSHHYCLTPSSHTHTHTPRPVLDLLISVGHVVAIAADLKRQNDPAREYTCSVLGGFNTFTLMASNMWYLVLAVDLAKAIRNPFK